MLYLRSGSIGGGLIVAVVVLLTRRGNQGPAKELAKRLETIDRSLRDEFSRNREEAGAAAKNQREELASSLEGVSSIVDVRLRQLQDDNAKQIDKMRATVDEKLQGTLEKRLANPSSWSVIGWSKCIRALARCGNWQATLVDCNACSQT